MFSINNAAGVASQAQLYQSSSTCVVRCLSQPADMEYMYMYVTNAFNDSRSSLSSQTTCSQKTAEVVFVNFSMIWHFWPLAELGRTGKNFFPGPGLKPRVKLLHQRGPRARAQTVNSRDSNVLHCSSW
jgi:hypothetical protein